MARKTAVQDDGYSLSLKVTEKGGVSVYGLQRFPVTLYADQWRAILSRAAAIESFMQSNAKGLKGKPDAKSGGPSGSTSI